jgi:hypothetical protein
MSRMQVDLPVQKFKVAYLGEVRKDKPRYYFSLREVDVDYPRKINFSVPTEKSAPFEELHLDDVIEIEGEGEYSTFYNRQKKFTSVTFNLYDYAVKLVD